MGVIRFDRFRIDPADTEQLLARRNALVTAVRAAVPGLVAARLARVDGETWVDMWHWESRARAQVAVELARSGAIPQAAAVFGLARDHTTEFVEVVDER
jgi:hypothetical protein